MKRENAAPEERVDGRCGPLVEEERDEQRTNLFRRVLLVLDERGGRTQEAVGLKKKKKKKRIFKRQTQKSFVGYAKFRVLEHLHRLAEKKKLPRVKVMCERNVRVRVCVCVLLRRLNKIVHLNGFA